jgi:hypothetical protein
MQSLSKAIDTKSLRLEAHHAVSWSVDPRPRPTACNARAARPLDRDAPAAARSRAPSSPPVGKPGRRSRPAAAMRRCRGLARLRSARPAACHPDLERVRAAATRLVAPGCLGWRSDRTRLLAALAGEFVSREPLDRLLDRFGDFASYKSIQYWSVTRQQWQPLVSSAGLLGRAPPNTNLTARDFGPGAVYDYFEQDRLGTTNYLMTVRERSTDRVVVVSRNTTPIRMFLGTLFEPGALEATAILEQHGPDRWGCWQATRAGAGAGMLATIGTESYVNRLTALFGYIAQRPAGR